ncbi:NAD(P)-dependent oxidoreductase [Tropicimonas aquimaris]|uniref:NAD(P)-dependent oxidoreductase n=1 Tax=Tropicimonas aquimaris TaxID=914152 RepID=A0ABW3IXJ8_9RHOB
MANVTIVGFGVMGRAAGRLLLDAGHALRISDPAPASLAAAAEMGVEAVSLGAVADRPGLVLLFLPGPDQIRHVVSGAGGLLATAKAPITIVDHSTANPEVARDMAELAAAQGHHWIDAPVLGRPQVAGKWTLPIGQTEGALEAARPVLECYAANLFEIGEAGSGHVVKLLNQMMFGAINAMTAEMMAVAERLGVAPARLYEIMMASNAATVSNLYRELGKRVSEDRYDEATFSMRLLEKDVRLGLEMARAAGLEPKVGASVAALNEAALEPGLGDEDTAVLWKVVASDR